MLRLVEDEHNAVKLDLLLPELSDGAFNAAFDVEKRLDLYDFVGEFRRAVLVKGAHVEFKGRVYASANDLFGRLGLFLLRLDVFLFGVEHEIKYF